MRIVPLAVIRGSIAGGAYRACAQEEIERLTSERSPR
jgi:hypothetical protein